MKAAVDKEKCTGCGQCADICPVEAIRVEDDIAMVNDDCIECGVCTDTCPFEAITFDE
ncbi:MAG: 4Fe-4S dicluster domain-containing protein [Syntrophomonadaceae bacterium]